MNLKRPPNTLIHILLIVVVSLFAYSNTFHSPFQWDDGHFIGENPAVKDLSYFLEPAKAEGSEFYSTLKSRYIGYLSFALNYKLHGLDVTGYHIVNLAIHILNALLLYFLVILTFKTPFLDKALLKKHSGYIALLTGLVFVAHPVQTEAVTYVFQRLASLVAFFYLLSLSAYAGFRLSTGNAKRYMLYALSLISAVLAMKTKENAFTLPFVIMLYEFFFFRGRTTPRMTPLIPFLLTLFIIPFTLTGIDKPVGEIIGSIGPAIRGCYDISKGDYLLTELRVVVTYIRLLFFPVNQNIAYDYPVFHSFFTSVVFLSFLLLLSIFSLAVYLFHRSRLGIADLRLPAFGLFWFFITLSVESSIIPIPMLINEYRVYLPSAGVFITMTSGAFLLMEKLKAGKPRAVMVSFLILVPLVLSCATRARNSIWESEVSLWEDTVRKSPHRATAFNNLGVAYGSIGLIDEAIEHFRIALKLKPFCAEAYNNLGIAYASKGLADKAIEHYRIALSLKPDYAEAHNNLGIVYGSTGLTGKAIEHFQITSSLKPDYAEVHANLGMAYSSIGLVDKAMECYRTTIRLNPDYADVHYNIGLIYIGKGMADEARREFETALKLNPGNYQARRFLDYVSDINKPRSAH